MPTLPLRKRQENIAANARALAALGLQGLVKRQREAGAEVPRERERVFKQRTRVSLRTAGLDADAEDTAVEEALVRAWDQNVGQWLKLI